MKLSKNATIVSLIVGIILISAGTGHLIYARFNFYEGHELVKYSEYWSMYRSVVSTNESLVPGNNIFNPGNSSLNLKNLAKALNLTIYLDGISSVLNPLSPLIEDNWTKSIEGDTRAYELFRKGLEDAPPQINSNVFQVYTRILAENNYYRVLDTFCCNTQRIYLKHLQLLYNATTERFICHGISNGSRSYIEFSLNTSNMASLEISFKWNVYVTQRYGPSLIHNGDAPVLKIIIKKLNNLFNINVIMKAYYAYISLYLPIQKQLWTDYILIFLGVGVILTVSFLKLVKKEKDSLKK